MRFSESYLGAATSDYDSHKSAVVRLQKGIVATKYNYSNMEIKNVSLRLSEDRKSLIYTPLDANEKKSFFSIERNVALSGVHNFLYGGVTSNFKKH